MWLALVGLELEMRVKIGEAGSCWPSPHQLGPVTAEVMVLLLGWLLQRMWVRILLSYVIWPLFACILYLSDPIIPVATKEASHLLPSLANPGLLNSIILVPGGIPFCFVIQHLSRPSPHFIVGDILFSLKWYIHCIISTVLNFFIFILLYCA